MGSDPISARARELSMSAEKSVKPNSSRQWMKYNKIRHALNIKKICCSTFFCFLVFWFCWPGGQINLFTKKREKKAFFVEFQHIFSHDRLRRRSCMQPRKNEPNWINFNYEASERERWNNEKKSKIKVFSTHHRSMSRAPFISITWRVLNLIGKLLSTPRISHSSASAMRSIFHSHRREKIKRSWKSFKNQKETFP